MRTPMSELKAAAKSIGTCVMLVLLMLFASSCGCGGNDTPTDLPYTKTIEVVRVFYHTCNHFSAMEQAGSKLKVHNFYHNIEVFVDVPADKPMYVIHHHLPEAGYVKQDTYEIHVHSPKELGTGEYRSGKSGTRQSQPIE